MTPNFWANVQVAIQTALATAITAGAGGITKANPGVMTYTGTDPVNGDYFVLTANGMYQVDDRVFRAANVNGAGNTVELEGEDTTLYDTLVSASAQVITFGASMANGVGIQASGGEADFAEIGTFHGRQRKRAPVTTSPLQLSFECLFDPTDAFGVEAKKAAITQTKRAIRLTFATGVKMVLNAYVSASGVPTGNAGEAVKTTISLEAQGLPTIYST